MANFHVTQQSAIDLRTIRRRLLPSLIYAAVIPYLSYRVANEHFHLPAVDALLLAAIAPACGALFEFLRKRQMSVLGLFALVGIAAKIVSALLFHDPHLVLIGDSLMSGVYGLLLLGSVLIGKPVVVVFAANLFEKKSPEQRAQLAQRLQDPAFRYHVQVLTSVWGVGLLLLLGISLLLTYTLPIALVLLIRPVIDYGMIGVLIVVTAAYGYFMRARRREQTTQ